MSRNLIVAAGYPFLIFAILYGSFRVDNFLIFADEYMIVTMIVLPLIIVGFLLTFRGKNAGRWYGRFAACLWIVAVSALHFWLVVQFAKGV